MPDRGNAISAFVIHRLSGSAIGCAPASSDALFPGGSFNARTCIEARSDV
jgi:hypothetical protein